MSGNYYGYIRVSTKEQNELRQVIALQEFGVKKKNIYIDKWSGKDFDRPGYQNLLKKMRAGDVIVVKSIDRFGRNYEEIKKQWNRLTGEMKVDIVVLDMPLLDTRKKDKDLTGTFVADLVFQILSYVAELERENIRQRQAEGIAAAKAKGVRFGKTAMEIPERFYYFKKEYNKGTISARAAAKELGVAHSTFLKWNRKIG